MAYYGYPQINPALQNWYGQFYQPVQQPMQPQVQPQMQPQIVPQMGQYQQQAAQAQAQPQQQAAVQMGGFIRVPSEEVARNWNVAPGTSATFINENAPYCYTKTVEMSQLDRPKFDKYRLVKEEDTPAPAPMDSPVSHEKAPQRSEGYGMNNLSDYALKTELAEVRGELEALRRRIETANRKTEKKGVTEDAEPVD